MDNTGKNIENRLAELEAAEARIEAEEKEILATDQQILETLKENRSASGFSHGLYKFRFIISILLTIGVALVWQAVGQISATLPLVSTAVGALALGLLILLLIDRLSRAK